jgi:hypothetical protein
MGEGISGFHAHFKPGSYRMVLKTIKKPRKIFPAGHADPPDWQAACSTPRKRIVFGALISNQTLAGLFYLLLSGL